MIEKEKIRVSRYTDAELKKAIQLYITPYIKNKEMSVLSKPSGTPLVPKDLPSLQARDSYAEKGREKEHFLVWCKKLAMDRQKHAVQDSIEEFGMSPIRPR